MSPMSAREAVKLGYTNVRVLSSGLPGWKKASGMVVLPRNGLKKMIHEDESYVLIDLRSKETASAGHIKGAVSLPEVGLAGAKDKFPQDKSAPVILYSDDQASEESFKLLRSWGYKNASVLDRGAKGWDGRFFPGEPASDIVYVKKIKSGQITVVEFEEIAKTKPADKVILDVRDRGSEGIIPGAVCIPQAELTAKLGELDKNKEYIIHCNTGILAALVYNTLAENGYQARYLDAVVQVSPDGSIEVTEK